MTAAPHNPLECISCRNKAAHPPFLFVFNYATHDYEPAGDDRCAARWATSRLLCGDTATERIGDIPVCRHHYRRAEQWRRDIPLEEHQANIDRRRAWDLTQVEAERAHRANLERRLRDLNLVYYVRRTSDGLVKIGTTGSFPQRLAALRTEHGELEVLLTHSGGRTRERQLHRRFAEWRVIGEWFCLGSSLFQWIADHRASYDLRSTQLPGTLTIGQVRALGKHVARQKPEYRFGRPIAEVRKTG